MRYTRGSRSSRRSGERRSGGSCASFTSAGPGTSFECDSAEVLARRAATLRLQQERAHRSIDFGADSFSKYYASVMYSPGGTSLSPGSRPRSSSSSPCVGSPFASPSGGTRTKLDATAESFRQFAMDSPRFSPPRTLRAE